ncbi:hypothetical protein AM629_00845 [Photorhabdus heterorhabditis]|uniref:Uncharacterized protein n=1 Tax=Photorhabdus heterorhabditis TaxID=880156 RepID=A0ABR5KHN5_9GAMM|nr:hypothetical protein AM629_00845 [Photorhabdus heterorhabditis]
MQISSELPETFQCRWPSIHSLIEMAFERRVKGETYCDSREYVNPLPLDTEAAAKAIRHQNAREQSGQENFAVNLFLVEL